jgi:hypothetical protein
VSSPQANEHNLKKLKGCPFETPSYQTALAEKEGLFPMSPGEGLQNNLIKPFGFFVFPSTPLESKLSQGLLASRVIPRGELRMKNLQFASYEGLLASRVIPRGELQSYLIKPFGFFVFPSTPLESKLSLVFR